MQMKLVEGKPRVTFTAVEKRHIKAVIATMGDMMTMTIYAVRAGEVIDAIQALVKDATGDETE